MPSVRNTSSKERVNWLPRSRTSAFELASLWPWTRNRLRAAWTVQAAVGLVVMPPRVTSRVVTSMKNNK